MTVTKTGVPSAKEFIEAKESTLFSELHEYSNKYLSSNAEILKLYRWPVDALTQWSRIYEYQFCYENLLDQFDKNLKILDAGCGITFFPFLVDNKFEVECLDQDDYTNIINTINLKQNTNIKFTKAPMADTPLESESIDVIFCISVLEHTKNHREIIKEFHRLLNPGGKIIVTFDISLNKESDFMGIDVDGALDILDCMSGLFDMEYSKENLLEDLNRNNLYTTQYVSNNLDDINLPWPRKRDIKTLIKENFFKQQNFTKVDITFCNVVGYKK
tara:strand:+ start:2268 stop:3086 length:819 start_codon:yes stop_codon:yes gene_type:complete